MKQSYDKAQREKAKKDSLPLVCIGFNGQYQPDKTKGTEGLFWGPVSPKMFEKIRKLFVEVSTSNVKDKT